MGIGLLLPARGDAADVLDWATKIAIAVLFFLYGTRLEPREAIEGLKHWKLHTTVLAATYVLFPLLGLAMRLLVPSVLTGFALAFARSVGEYGSVIFIAANVPFVSEVAPLLIIVQLEEFNYAGATAIATVMLAISFLSLLAINLIQAWARRRFGDV